MLQENTKANQEAQKISSTKNHSMRILLRTVEIVAMVIALTFAVFYSYNEFIVKKSSEKMIITEVPESKIKTEDPKITSSESLDYIKKMQDIISYKYFYTNAAMFENQKNIRGFDVPFTSKRFILSYNGKMNLGVDLKNLKVDIIDNKIKISHLGEAKIISHEIDDSSIQVFDESTSIFSSFQITDYKKFFTSQKDEVEKKVLKGEMMEEARKYAEIIIAQLLNLNPKITGKYEIEFVADEKLSQ